MAKRQERRSFWTWGHVSDEPTEQQRREAASRISARFGREVSPPPVPDIRSIKLRKPRLEIPGELRDFVTSEQEERVTHTYGGHSTELLAAVRGTFHNPPDAVAHPRDEHELERILEWCSRANHSTIPYGGGTSVVWGLNVPEQSERAVSIDLDCMSEILEIDPISRAARIQAGMLGPDIEAALKPHGLTLRHYPQSFPWSTLGGWIATRSGGHYATNHTHIDDFVENITMFTPSRKLESRRLPGSGAGPSPDRLMIGSEGIFGVISESWVRLQKRPQYRATAGVRFGDWHQGTEAVREIVQLKLWPANLRILDPEESAQNAGLENGESLLIIGFESSDVPQGKYIEEAVAVARDHGGIVGDDDIAIDNATDSSTRQGSVSAWRNAFIGVNAGVQLGLGLLSDTFETSITWDKWPTFDRTIRSAVGDVLKRVLGEEARLSCRFTHVYPDGPAPYYSCNGPVAIGGEFDCWRQIKDAANEAIIDAGGTITHHHAVGRMHRSGWTRQMPDGYDNVLRAVKRELDPNGILNPGVLIDP